MQLIIRENNDHEGDSWLYVLDVTEGESQLIIDGLESEIDENIIEVLEGPISDEEILTIQKWCSTYYMVPAAKYRLNPVSFTKAVENNDMYGYVFYKATGLIKL